MTNSTQKVCRATRFTGSTWLAITDHVAREFGMSDEHLQMLRSKDIARLIGAIPFLAGCDDAAELATTNLRHYVMSCGIGKKLYAATPANSTDIFGRLAPAQYRGGDEAIVRRGMSLIALNMLADYKRDVELDASIGKYNPIGAGDWDYDEIYGRLIANVEAIECDEMDEIVEVHTIMNNNYWNFISFPDWF